MPNPNTFDEASAATQEMFAENEQLSLADAPLAQENAEVNPETEEDTPAATETPAEENPPVTEETPPANNTQTVLDEATQTAEVAAQAAADANTELMQARQEIEMLRQQNQQLQGTVDAMSQQNAQKTVEEALKPPTLDFNGLAFADEATQQAAIAQFAADMSAYNRQELMKEMSPALEYAKQGMREKEKTEVVSVLSQVPELAGIGDMLPQLDRIIANNKWLQSEDMPMDEKYINAFAIAKGVNSMNTPPAAPPKEPTTEELMAMYNNNPAFQELVEKQRLEQIKQSQQVPPFSASSGAVNAALNIKDKPQTLEEASERTRQMFGM